MRKINKSGQYREDQVRRDGLSLKGEVDILKEVEYNDILDSEKFSEVEKALIIKDAKDATPTLSESYARVALTVIPKANARSLYNKDLAFLGPVLGLIAVVTSSFIRVSFISSLASIALAVLMIMDTLNIEGWYNEVLEENVRLSAEHYLEHNSLRYIYVEDGATPEEALEVENILDKKGSSSITAYALFNERAFYGFHRDYLNMGGAYWYTVKFMLSVISFVIVFVGLFSLLASVVTEGSMMTGGNSLLVINSQNTMDTMFGIGLGSTIIGLIIMVISLIMSIYLSIKDTLVMGDITKEMDYERRKLIYQKLNIKPSNEDEVDLSDIENEIEDIVETEVDLQDEVDETSDDMVEKDTE